MQPMDQDYIEQHDIAQRYLHGKLTPEEAEAFEVYLMGKPGALEQIEHDMYFNKYLSGRSSLSTQQLDIGWKYWPGIRSSGALSAVPYSIAFIVGLFAAYIFFPGEDTVKRAQILELAPLRSMPTPEPPKVIVEPEIGRVLLILSPPYLTERENYHVSMQDADENLVFELTDVVSQEDGNLYVSVDTGKLSSGLVTIRYKAKNDRSAAFNSQVFFVIESN